MTRTLNIVTHVNIAAPVARCFEYIVPIELSRIFHRYLFLPGVQKTDESELWYKPGLSRTVYFSDGSTAKEQLLTVTPSTEFSYQITQFTGINKFLIAKINGAWQFNENNEATDIVWTYSLRCHNSVTFFITKTVVEPALKSYLNRALQKLKHDLDES